MRPNLTLFTEEICEFVDRYGFGILMSIDGCPDVQDAQRPAKNGKKMSSLVDQWARRLLRTRPRSQARATLHPDYVHRFFESANYLRTLGFREMCISASEYGKWTHSHFETLDIELDRIVEMVVAAYIERAPFNLTVLKYYAKTLVLPRERNPGVQLPIQKRPCGAGVGYMMVDYVGDVWPCHRFDGADSDVGAAGQFRLANIFQPGFNHDLQRAFLDFDHSVTHKATCESCPANPVCGGYCPAANLSDTGSIYTPHDTFCQWTWKLYAAAEKLAKRLRAIGGEAYELFLSDVATADSSGEK